LKPYLIEAQRGRDGGWRRKGAGEWIRQAGLQSMDPSMGEVRELAGERGQRRRKGPPIGAMVNAAIAITCQRITSQPRSGTGHALAISMLVW
jgi:hypothetical protein